MVVSFTHFIVEIYFALGMHWVQKHYSRSTASISLSLSSSFSDPTSFPNGGLIVHLCDRHDSKWPDFPIALHKRDTLKERNTNLHTFFQILLFQKDLIIFFPLAVSSSFPVPFQRGGIIYEGGECQATEMSLRRWRRFQSLQIHGSGPDLPVRALFLEWGMGAGEDWERQRESSQNHSCLNMRYSFVKHRHIYNDKMNDE